MFIIGLSLKFLWLLTQKVCEQGNTEHANYIPLKKNQLVLQKITFIWIFCFLEYLFSYTTILFKLSIIDKTYFMKWPLTFDLKVHWKSHWSLLCFSVFFHILRFKKIAISFLSKKRKLLQFLCGFGQPKT